MKWIAIDLRQRDRLEDKTGETDADPQQRSTCRALRACAFARGRSSTVRTRRPAGSGSRRSRERAPTRRAVASASGCPPGARPRVPRARSGGGRPSRRRTGVPALRCRAIACARDTVGRRESPRAPNPIVAQPAMEAHNRRGPGTVPRSIFSTPPPSGSPKSGPFREERILEQVGSLLRGQVAEQALGHQRRRLAWPAARSRWRRCESSGSGHRAGPAGRGGLLDEQSLVDPAVFRLDDLERVPGVDRPRGLEDVAEQLGLGVLRPDRVEVGAKLHADARRSGGTTCTGWPTRRRTTPGPARRRP